MLAKLETLEDSTVKFVQSTGELSDNTVRVNFVVWRVINPVVLLQLFFSYFPRNVFHTQYWKWVQHHGKRSPCPAGLKPPTQSPSRVCWMLYHWGCTQWRRFISASSVMYFSPCDFFLCCKLMKEAVSLLFWRTDTRAWHLLLMSGWMQNKKAALEISKGETLYIWSRINLQEKESHKYIKAENVAKKWKLPLLCISNNIWGLKMKWTVTVTVDSSKIMLKIMFTYFS